MLHNEARALILKAWDKTHNAEEIAECFSVDRSTVYRLVRRRNKTGEWQTRTHLRGRKPALSAEQKQKIIRLVEEQPDITINEIVERLRLSVCDETVHRVLVAAGLYLQEKVDARQRTGASPMSRRSGSSGARILLAMPLKTRSFWTKVASIST